MYCESAACRPTEPVHDMINALFHPRAVLVVKVSTQRYPMLIELLTQPQVYPLALTVSLRKAWWPPKSPPLSPTSCRSR